MPEWAKDPKVRLAWHLRCARARGDTAGAEILEDVLHERAESLRRVSELAKTNPGSARLLARGLGVRELV